MKALAYIPAALLLFSPALAQENRGRLTDVKWVAKPSGYDMAAAYPRRAQSEKLGGWALLSCRIGDDRRPTNCKIADEAPEGHGFGEASLKIVHKLLLKKPEDGESVAGRTIAIPMAWHMEGNTAPKSFPLGEPSMLVTIAPAGMKKRTFSCPSKTEPDRVCVRRELYWTARPELEDIAAIVRKGGDGLSAMECSVTSSGALEHCKIASSVPGITDEELLSIAKRFQAPLKAEDGTPTVGQRVVLTFDWKRLGNILDVFAAT